MAGDYTSVDDVVPGCPNPGICGTSYASPYAAGVAALILSRNPSLTAPQVEAIMQASAKDLGLPGLPGYDTEYGWGLVNARDALFVTTALVKVAPELGDVQGFTDPRDVQGRYDFFVSPKSRHAGLDSVTIELTEAVTLVSSCTTSTGGSPPNVSSLTQDPSNPLRHTVQFDAAIELAEWTTVTLTVENDSEVQAEIFFQLGHLPGDLNQDWQMSMADATTFGQIKIGSNGEGYLPDGTGGWLGRGLGNR